MTHPSPAAPRLSLGIGLTSACDLACPHCYRPTGEVHHLPLTAVRAACEALDPSSAGLGTGESCLHPELPAVLRYLAGRGVRISMASNGLTVLELSDAVLRLLNDVEVSLDFPSAQDQDAFRAPGSFRRVRSAVDRCLGLGIETTLLATLMSCNADRLDGLARLARRLGTNLRVNVFQAVRTPAFRPSYDQLWEAYRRLFAEARLIACSEPVVAAALGLDVRPSPCGTGSVRLAPDGGVAPCVYWPEAPLRIDDLVRLGRGVLDTPAFLGASAVPEPASGCPCLGGCAARRLARGAAHDEYCPWVRGDEVTLGAERLEGKDLPRAANVCTTIVG